MIATEEKKAKKMPRVVAIENVSYVPVHKLCILFNDGYESTVDFGPFLRHSLHPAICAYLEVERFKHFTLEDGALHWNGFDLVFPMADLYRGRIS